MDHSLIHWMQTTFGPGSQPFWEAVSLLASSTGVVVLISLSLWLSGTRLALRLACLAMRAAAFHQRVVVQRVAPPVQSCLFSF